MITAVGGRPQGLASPARWPVRHGPSQQIPLHRHGTDQFRPFIAHVVQRAAHRTPIHFRTIRIVQQRLTHITFPQPPFISVRMQYHRHPVVNAPHGFIRGRRQDDAAKFLRLQVQLPFRFRLPQTRKTKRPVVWQGEPDGRPVRRPLIKPVRRNQAAMMQMMLERRRGNRLRLS